MINNKRCWVELRSYDSEQLLKLCLEFHIFQRTTFLVTDKIQFHVFYSLINNVNRKIIKFNKHE